MKTLELTATIETNGKLIVQLPNMEGGEQMSELLFHGTVVVEKDGVLVLEDLPLKQGQQIEISVYDTDTTDKEAEDPFMLRSEPFYDTAPFEPVAVEDWEALQ